MPGKYRTGLEWIERGRDGVRDIIRGIANLTPPVWEEGVDDEVQSMTSEQRGQDGEGGMYV